MKGRFDLNKAINYKSPHLSSPEKLFYYPSVIYFTLNHFLFSDDLGRKPILTTITHLISNISWDNYNICWIWRWKGPKSIQECIHGKDFTPSLNCRENSYIHKCWYFQVNTTNESAQEGEGGQTACFLLAMSLILCVCFHAHICVCAYFPAVLSFCHKKLRIYYSEWPRSIDAHARLRQSMREWGEKTEKKMGEEINKESKAKKQKKKNLHFI